MGRTSDRGRMVEEQLAARGIRDGRVLDAFRKIERERFVPDDVVEAAYEDRPLPIGLGQTISQPFIAALMLQEARLTGTERVLEVGTGSGFLTAALAELAGLVVSLERHVPLADAARDRLKALGYEHVRVVIRDGTKGYERLGPYDMIMCSAAGPDAPPALIEQLRDDGGRLIMPIGEEGEPQTIYRFVREGYDVRREAILSDVSFVPLVGRFGFRPEERPIQW